MKRIYDLSEIRAVAREFIAQMGSNTIFTLKGQMGAGKTTFIKAVCEEMGVSDVINSPTFAIVNEYEEKNGRIIYHFDCYRIKDIEEARNIGAEEYLYSGNICFIEWFENIENLLPNTYTTVEIKIVDDNKREISW